MTKLTPEATYMQIRQLVAEMPDPLRANERDPKAMQWFGRAIALVGPAGPVFDAKDAMDLRSIQDHWGTDAHYDFAGQMMDAIMYRALARAELAAPPRFQGSFIAAGATLNAYGMVGKVLSSATANALFVDSYADEKILTDYALLAPEPVSIRVLAGDTNHKPTLSPAIQRWRSQYFNRQLEVRLAPSQHLHDRAIFIDGKEVWVLQQSFKDLALRSHTSIVLEPQEIAAEKIPAYEAIWQTATVLP